MGRIIYLFFLAIFVSFFLILSFLAQDKIYLILAAIVLTALTSISLLVFLLDDSWEGTIVDIKEKTKWTLDEDSNPIVYKITIAKIETITGASKYYPAAPSWKVGDRLVKLSGEANVQIKKK